MSAPLPLPERLRGACEPVLARRPAWQARLHLGIERRGDRSVLAQLAHAGPLRVQKALYPEGPDMAQLLMLHPPGGIAGGDELEVSLTVAPQAHALLTTPGAGKWYRAAGRLATQSVRLSAASGAVLEWLPQEAIVFNGAVTQQTLSVDCAGDGVCIGWDIAVLGRQGSAERFEQGCWSQHIALQRDGRPLWSERGVVHGGDALLEALVGWNGLHVSGLLWCLGPTLDEAALEACRDLPTDARLHAGLTQPSEGLLLARVLGDSPERVRALLLTVWARLRPVSIGRPARAPRIWAT